MRIFHPMKTYSKSILPELDGWEERLALVLQSVDQHRTIGRLRSKDGKPCVAAKLRRTHEQELADFWFRVKVTSPRKCWNWAAGTRGSKGYGSVQISGRTQRAHRIAAIARYGVFDNHLLSCHHCDNPKCCNPHHLFIGDGPLNSLDMVAKGRASRRIGINNPGAKLTEEQVREIKRRALSPVSGFRTRTAKEFSVTRRSIYEVLAGRKWKHITI